MLAGLKPALFLMTEFEETAQLALISTSRPVVILSSREHCILVNIPVEKNKQLLSTCLHHLQNDDGCTLLVWMKPPRLQKKKIIILPAGCTPGWVTSEARS